MRVARLIIFLAVFLLMTASVQAVEVRVFKPTEEDLFPMQLRNQAMAEGFAEAVLGEAVAMLPAGIDEARQGLLKEYFITHSKPYIQGYKILGSQAMEAGLILRLDVRVNRKALRGGLNKMGFFQTAQSPLSAAVSWPEDLDEEGLLVLQNLVVLTGITPQTGEFPSLVVSPGPEKTFKGQIFFEGKEFRSINKDVTELWFDLWAHYFTRAEAVANRDMPHELSITGWFAPDAALEFDRVLLGWESVVQEARLVELDMQPVGVGATWEIRTLNEERLKTMLHAYLPERGLSFLLSRGGQK
jgi:hypothetical protein